MLNCKTIIAKKKKANEFAYKGGRLRLVAKRMRELAEDLEDELVDVRQEDRTIRNFTIPAQDEFWVQLLRLVHLLL